MKDGGYNLSISTIVDENWQTFEVDSLGLMINAPYSIFMKPCLQLKLMLFSLEQKQMSMDYWNGWTVRWLGMGMYKKSITSCKDICDI